MRRRGIYRETPETKLKKEFLKVLLPANLYVLTTGHPFIPTKWVRYPPENCHLRRFCADCPCNNDNYIRRANSRLGIFLCF